MIFILYYGVCSFLVNVLAIDRHTNLYTTSAPALKGTGFYILFAIITAADVVQRGGL